MCDDKKGKHIYSVILKGICIAAVIYGFTTISEGLRTFTKFTTLSNIGIGIAVVIVFLDEIKPDKVLDMNSIQTKYIFKFMMTSAILLTFLLYLLILAPTNEKGFIGAYLNNRCGSLAHHFISPIAAIVDFVIFDKRYQPKIYHILLGMITPLVYVAYVFILGITGYRWPGNMYAPYNFLNYGTPVGWWGFDLSQIGSTSLGIGVAYMVLGLLVFFVFLGWILIVLKRIFGDFGFI